MGVFILDNHIYNKVIIKAPAVINNAPMPTLQVNFSAKNKVAKITTNTTLNLSNAATPEAGPNRNAKK